MRAVRSRNTGPEMVLRRLLYAMGYRYRLHTSLPGRPDIAIAKRHKAIFVHGCFWHRHPRCAKARLPKTNLAYWQPKLSGNVARDRRAKNALHRMGWDVLVIWQCQLINEQIIRKKVRTFLGPPPLAAKRRPANSTAP